MTPLKLKKKELKKKSLQNLKIGVSFVIDILILKIDERRAVRRSPPPRQASSSGRAWMKRVAFRKLKRKEKTETKSLSLPTLVQLKG